MTGILEQILGELSAIRAQIAAGGTGGAAYSPPATVGYVAPVAPLAPVADPNALAAQQYAAVQLAQQQQFAAAQAAQQQAQVPTGVNADMLTNLIQPHVANQAIKDDLGTAMRAMGINALPETQPHQYGALYAAFQQVIARHTGGGAAPSAPALNNSII